MVEETELPMEVDYLFTCINCGCYYNMYNPSQVQDECTRTEESHTEKKKSLNTLMGSREMTPQ